MTCVVVLLQSVALSILMQLVSRPLALALRSIMTSILTIGTACLAITTAWSMETVLTPMQIIDAAILPMGMEQPPCSVLSPPSAIPIRATKGLRAKCSAQMD